MLGEVKPTNCPIMEMVADIQTKGLSNCYIICQKAGVNSVEVNESIAHNSLNLLTGQHSHTLTLPVSRFMSFSCFFSNSSLLLLILSYCVVLTISLPITI